MQMCCTEGLLFPEKPVTTATFSSRNLQEKLLSDGERVLQKVCCRLHRPRFWPDLELRAPAELPSELVPLFIHSAGSHQQLPHMSYYAEQR